MILDTKKQEALIHNKAFGFTIGVEYKKLLLELLELLEDAETLDSVRDYTKALRIIEASVKHYNFAECSAEFENSEAAREIRSAFRKWHDDVLGRIKNDTQ